ncbi:MAG: serine/threonine-protein kinase [Phycisphaerae bacterium]|nr:serine/threonine-protein kinase [Phycisphaerae bacterium]
MDSPAPNTAPLAPAASALANDAGGPLPQIDGYDIVAPIGRGGMGVVYEGLQRATGARVAIKFMLTPPGAVESLRRRFEREVDLIARLQHHYIVRLIDSGVHRGQYFYVMDYVEGRSPLLAFPASGGPPAIAAIELVEKICAAVDFAHQRGVLHRDLKPSNILVDERGDPHLLDFGLAKSIDPASGAWLDATLSEPGQLLGTLGYMSPEQSRGERGGSVRSDVYSLGAIAYELFTGQLPCKLDGPLSQVLSRIETVDPPRPSSLVPALRGDLDAILLKALAKEPLQRYATASELAADLRRHRLREPIAARPASLWLRGQRWVQRNRAVAAVGGAATLALVTLGLFSAVRIIRERDRAIANEALAREKLRFALEAIDQLVFDTDQRLENMIGVADVRQGLLEVALDFYESLPKDAALLGLERLTAPQYGRLGDALYSRGDRETAERFYRESLKQYQAAAAAANSQQSRDFALAWQRIASIETDQSAARAALVRAAEIHGRLAKAAAGDSSAAADAADAWMRVAEHDAASQRFDELAAVVRRAIDSTPTVAPQSQPSEMAVRVAIERAGLLRRAVSLMRNLEPALFEETCSAAIACADALHRDFADNAEVRREASALLCRTASSMLERGPAPLALAALDRARDAAQEAAQRWPRDMRTRVALSEVYSATGNEAARRGRLDEARDWYEKELALIAGAFEMQPADATYRLRYSQSLVALGTVAVLQKRWPEAADHYDQFLKVSEPLAREDPAHLPARAYAWHVVGDQLNATGDGPAARECYEAGLADLETLATFGELDDYAVGLRDGLTAALAAPPNTSQPSP